MKKKAPIVILLLIFALLLSACGKKDPLLGTWEEPASEITLKFSDDGSLVIGRGGASYSVTYEKREPNIIAITAEGIDDFPLKEVSYKFVDEYLVITVDNVDTTFTRLK